MKRFVSISCAVVAVLMSVTLLAQDKTNFAGTWSLVPDANAAGSNAMAGFGEQFVAVQDAKTLTITTNNPQMGELKQVLNLDGSESKNPVSFGGNTFDRSSKIKWSGNKLVVKTTINVQGNNIEMTQTLSVDPAGTLTVETSSDMGQNGPMTVKTTYKKAS